MVTEKDDTIINKEEKNCKLVKMQKFTQFCNF